jgi:uncharacterized secreted protein with C-terminal beta-propeller domain
MRKLGVLLLICTLVIACKLDNKKVVELEESHATDSGKTSKQNDGFIAVQGEFIYYGNAAVLKTSNKIYGVVIDDVMQELQVKVKPFKAEDTDMVPVTVRGRLFKKNPNEQGWEDKIEIKEILKVSAPSLGANDVIKIGNK